MMTEIKDPRRAGAAADRYKHVDTSRNVQPGGGLQHGSGADPQGKRVEIAEVMDPRRHISRVIVHMLSGWDGRPAIDAARLSDGPALLCRNRKCVKRSSRIWKPSRRSRRLPPLLPAHVEHGSSSSVPAGAASIPSRRAVAILDDALTASAA
jgi:hypothetical protein